MNPLSTNRGREVGFAFVLLAPVALLVIVLIGYPFINAVATSFTDKAVGRDPNFVGLSNYTSLATNAAFRTVLWNSAVFTVVSVLAKAGLGLVSALALNKVVAGRQTIRAILLLPWILPTVVIATAWRWMFDFQRGFLNSMLKDAGILESGLHWLGNPDLAMVSVIAANVWRGFPFFTISLLAAIQTIPRDLYEAAELDGAGAWRKFRHVTLPHISGVFAVVGLLSTIWTINDFNIVYIMTRGGPGIATQIFATYSYELGMQSQRWGMAIAASMYSLPAVAVLIYFTVRHIQRSET